MPFQCDPKGLGKPYASIRQGYSILSVVLLEVLMQNNMGPTCTASGNVTGLEGSTCILAKRLIAGFTAWAKTPPSHANAQ